MIHCTTLKQRLPQNAPGRQRGSFVSASSWVTQTIATLRIATLPGPTQAKPNYCIDPERMTSIPAGLLFPLKAVFPKGRKGYSIWQSSTWYQEVLGRGNYGEHQTSHFSPPPYAYSHYFCYLMLSNFYFPSSTALYHF